MMPMQRSDDAPKRRRSIAVIELAVLAALGALLLIAIVIGGSDDEVAERARETVPASETEGSETSGTAGTASSATSITPTTTPAARSEEPASPDGSPTHDASEPAMNTAEVLPVDDDTATDADPATEPTTEFPEPEVTASVNGPFATIDVTRQFACGLLTDGRARCWGEDPVGQAETADSLYSALDAGSWAGCGLRGDGGIECWGAIDDYAFDAFEGPFGSFAVGWGVLCAVRFDGVVICSASDLDSYPHKPLFDVVLTVTAGAGTFCAITENHEAKCWDELLFQSRAVSPLVAATPPEGPFAKLFIGQGDDVACGIRRDRTVACWGDIALIGADDPPGHFVQLAVGVFHACGLRLDGTIACWSDGSYDHDGTPAGQFIDLSVGFFHSCGVRDDGELICWDADTAERLPVPRGSFTDVESFEIENCALRRDGAAVCWQQSF